MSDIKFNQLVEFIENHYETKLYDYQKFMLKAMVDGNTISVPKQSGRTMILEGYIEWLNSIHTRHRAYEEAEVHITMQNIFNERNMLSEFECETEKLKFEQEYECQWIGEK